MTHVVTDNGLSPQQGMIPALKPKGGTSVVTATRLMQLEYINSQWVAFILKTIAPEKKHSS